MTTIPQIMNDSLAFELHIAGIQKAKMADMRKIYSLETKLESVIAERDEARAELLRLYMGAELHEGWEEEPTTLESSSRALDKLANWGLDPHIPQHRERVQAALTNSAWKKS